MWVGSQVTNHGRETEVLLEEPLPLETARESPSFKLEPMETERSPGPRLQELLGPSPQRDPQAVKERGEAQLSGQVGGRRGLGLAPDTSRMSHWCEGEGIAEVKVHTWNERPAVGGVGSPGAGGREGSLSGALFYVEQRRFRTT